jgi:asparagine synthase (glutamine-hydrolysing)
VTGDAAPETLLAMLESISHRGPDDEGSEWLGDTGFGGKVGLGNRRLAILDLSPAGHQPMHSQSGCLAYNGEVYNFRDLRSELESRGEVFSSGSDTEVVLRLLGRGVVEGLARLNGMFAVAYWDSEERALYLARDRFAIKPLYYAVLPSGRLLFGSEVKALIAGGFDPQLSLEDLGSYLSFGWVPAERTLFTGVLELPPGCLLKWKDGGASIERFRDAVPVPDEHFDREAASTELRERLTDAVSRQMVADVPVGILLSGGLDSSAIAALARAAASGPVRAYSIAFRPADAHSEQSSEDAAFARMVARELDISLKEFVVDPDVAPLLEVAALHIDDPVADPAALLTYLICESARSEVTVLLSGQGSDELFAGYRVQLYQPVSSAAGKAPSLARRGALAVADSAPRAARVIPGLSPGVAAAFQRTSHAMLDDSDLPEDRRYTAARAKPYFVGRDLFGILAEQVREEVLGSDPWASHLRYLSASEHPGLGFFDRMLYADLNTFLWNQNLAYGDRMSMAASIETRVPFLDDAVADLALRLPKGSKVRRFKGKVVLRDAVRGLVPGPVIDRRKVGFGMPVRAWMRGELRPLLNDSLSSDWLRRTGLFDPGAVRSLLDEHAAGRADHTLRIWTLLTFALWHRRWVEGVEPAR